MYKDNIKLPVSTNRLIIRKFQAQDYEAYCAYRMLPSTYRYLYKDLPKESERQEQFAKVVQSDFTKDGDVFWFAAMRQDDHSLLGEVLLKLANQNARQAEVGYIFNPAFSGHGYATEAVKAVIDIAFHALDFHRVFARLDTKNTGSVNLVERLGLRREAHLLQNDQFNNQDLRIEM